MARINYLRVGPTVATYVRVGDIFGTYEVVTEVREDRIFTNRGIYHVKHYEEHEDMPKDCCAIYVGDSVENSKITKISPNPLKDFSEILHTNDIDNHKNEKSFMVIHGGAKIYGRNK